MSQHPQHWPTLPLVILVNHTTAGSAELFAGALQDHDRAVIIGLPTSGRGSTQTLYPVDDVGTLKLTTTRWFTPSGRSISKISGEADPDTTPQKPTYKTDGGRTIVGGGGITTDVVIGDPTTHRTPQPLAPAATDTILITAQRLLTGIHSQPEALSRAARMAALQKPST
jgi:carboxyl-terminal processing protease